MNEQNTVKLLYYFQSQGIVLWCADGEKLSYSSSDPIPDLIFEKIKENRQHLIRFLADRKVVEPYQIPFIFTLNSSEYPLSPAQERLWFLAQLQEKDNYIYNEPVVLTFDKRCDPNLLRKTLKILIERHTCFRTLFKRDENGSPKQIILPFKDDLVELILPLNVESIDDQDLPKYLDARIKSVFDLSMEISIRCYLYHLKGSNKYVLYILQHHIITDGTSIGLLLSEFYTIYNKLLSKQEVNLSKIDIQYSDYAVWFREYYKKDNLTNQLSYWINKLEGFQTLQIQKDNSKGSESRSVTYKYEIESSLFGDLKVFSKKNKTTLQVSLLAAFYILLNRYSNQNDIVVGTLINGRNLPQIKNILGFFINTIVLRAKIKKQRICDFLLDINQLYIEALKYQDLPFEMLVDSMGINRVRDLSPIFQVLFAYQKFVIPGFETGDTSWLDNDFSDAATKFDLTFDFKETGNKLVASIQYKSNLFLNQTILRMMAHYVNILKEMVQFPECEITKINVLARDEYNNIIYNWNNSSLPYLKDKTINQFFEEYAAKTPDNIAVSYVDSSLTYFELNEEANKLANFIRLHYLNYYKTELSPDILIVISMERCLELVIAILAVIKAGGAYVPLDPSYPQERKRFILEDTDAKLILTREAYFKEFKKIVSNSQKILVLDKDLKAEDLENKNLKQFSLPSSTVYVIYTSGSTGTPKGVCVTHLSLNNFVSSAAIKINFTSKKILNLTSFTFDVFCFDFFCSLCSGGTLILTDNVIMREPNMIIDYIKYNKPDIIIATPSLWHMIIDKMPPTFKLTVLSIGEPLHENLAKKLFKISTDVWDAYGPTETTVFSIIKKLDPTEKFSIGKPLSNVTAYILNENLQPVPIGVVGELYIGGDCLAKGYLNRPDLTKDRFINNPFISESERNKKTNLKIYKTGDLVYWLPSGDIKYVGRNDFQVKISGHRIELGELESVLNQFPKLKQSIVLPIKSDMSMQLVVYYTAENKIEESVLRDYLGIYLPTYMIPHIFIYLERFPVNNNGKIDTKNLPRLNLIDLSESIILPRNSIEEELSDILTNALNVKPFSVDKNIFDIGCNSLKAVQVQTKINNHFNSKIKVVDVFNYPTIEKLALFLNDEIVEPKNFYPKVNNTANVSKKEDIAIIGYSCSFPMSDSVEEYWTNIREGKECIRRLEREECVRRGVSADILNHEKYLPYAGVVLDIDMFDAEFWELSEHDALFMGPKMRLFLEQAWKAIESSGYIKKRKQISVGLFASFGKLDYLDRLLQLENINQTISYFDYSMLSSSDYFLNRVAYLLGISGPSLSIDTACSSASVAVIEGCQKLLAGKCDIVIAGGVNLCSTHDFGHVYFEGMELLSKDGHSRIFDEKAGGIVRSDGIGVVVLKRLSEAIKDQDYIRAVIKGYGTSYDGMRKFGNVYPRLSSLKECILEAQQNLEQANIDYIECHGMGFKLGELFEFDALRETFKHRGTNNTNKCILGSVKANIGHTGYASGIAQLIKVVCMLEHRTFPPQINYMNPYTEFNLDNEPFQIIKEEHTWQESQDNPKVAGMTSFGIGGTNVHIILQEATNNIQPSNRRLTSNFLISLSAKSAQSLTQMRNNLSNYLNSYSDLNMLDVAYTLHLAREEFNHRLAFVCHDAKSCIRLLKSNYSDMQSLGYVNHLNPHKQQTTLVFNCPDVIANPTTISKVLYETESAYHDEVDYCTTILNDYLGVDIREVMLDNNNSSSSVLKQSIYFACISFVNNYAISRFLNSCGLKMQVIIGEGTGEYLAACLAGIISLEDMFKLFLMREGTLPNAQIEVFSKSLQKIQVDGSNISCLSARTGKAISIITLLDQSPSKSNLDKLKTISEHEVTKLIPADSFCITFAQNKPSINPIARLGVIELLVCNNSREVDDRAHLLNIIAKLWLQGVEIKWEYLYSDKAGRFIELPTYSFSKVRIDSCQESQNHEGPIINDGNTF